MSGARRDAVPGARRTVVAIGSSIALLGTLIGGQVVLHRSAPGDAPSAPSGVSTGPAGNAKLADAEACPASLPQAPTDAGHGMPTVPEPPVGWDGSASLVPSDTPARAILCRYGRGPAATRAGRFDQDPVVKRVVPSASSPAGPEPLRRQVTLGGDLSGLAGDLALLPSPAERPVRACTLIGTGDVVHTLLRLDYPDGRRVWVVADNDPNGCTDAVNGRFSAAAFLGDRFDAAVASGRWEIPSRPGESPCASGWYPGRTGQAQALIPESPTRLVVCGSMLPDAPRQDLRTGERLAEALAAARALPAARREDLSLCLRDPGARHLTVYVDYDHGPGISLLVTGTCVEQLGGGSMRAQDPTGSLLRLLDVRGRGTA